jgi:hypothetical protein
MIRLSYLSIACLAGALPVFSQTAFNSEANELSAFTTAAVGGGVNAVGDGVTPEAVSISPTSGTGLTQVFTVTYTDPNGVADIQTALLMVNPTINAANSCVVEYNRVTDRFRLLDDAGTGWSTTVPPGGISSLTNSNCTFTASGSAATVSGNTLTVAFRLTLTGANNTRNTYGLATDAANHNSGWMQLGTWTLGSTPPPPPPSGPEVISLTPTAGSGLSGTFTGTFRHGGGPTKHYHGYMLFLPLPNIVSFNAQGTCLVEYNRISNGMRLIDNAGTGWLGPLVGVPVTPSAAPLANNACTVNIAGTVITFAGNDMIMAVPVTFNAANVTAVMGTFIQGHDVDDKWTDFRQFGNWTVPGAGNKPGAFVTSATPTSGAGSTVTLTTSVGHTSGANNIGQVHIRMDSKIVGGTACHAVYFPGSNEVALVKDDNSGIVGPVSLGTAVNTNRCSLPAGAGTRSLFGNNLTVTLTFTFNPAAFGGAKNVYVDVFDVQGGVSHWVQTGTWTVQ